jgi:Leucine-rich repeat (LRR) protein
MPGNLFCDQCRKHIGDYANSYFSDREKDLDFCSEECQLEWNKENWEGIEGLTIELKTEWERWGFDQSAIKKWIEFGLDPDDYGFADWLKKQKGIISYDEMNRNGIEKLKEECWNNYLKILDWKKLENILKYSEPEIIGWVKRGFDYQETMKWIEILGWQSDIDFVFWLKEERKLTPQKFQQIRKLENLKQEYQKLWTDISMDFDEEHYWWKIYQEEWKKKGFSYQEVGKWIASGLKSNEAEFADYLKKEDHQPDATNLEVLRKKFYHDAQIWLDEWYPKDGVCKDEYIVSSGEKYLNNNLDKTRDQITELNLCEKNLTGSLDLSTFPNLTKLYIWRNKITSLNLADLNKLEELFCNINDLTSLDFLNDLNKEKLECLIMNDNKFSDSKLDFLSDFVNLEGLNLRNNNFSGSLKPLQNMKNLAFLDIADTDLDEGLEFLPKSISNGVFLCSAKRRPSSKVKALEEDWKFFDQDLKKYEKSIDGTYKTLNQWLDQNYPENDVCQREGDEKNKDKKRSDISQLDISDQKLEGRLRMKGFTNLKELNCSNNQLTSLNLGDCPNLTEFKCDNNKFDQDLEVFSFLKDLELLSLKNCSFGGSLRPLEKLDKLEALVISNTNLSEGLEYLPESCERLFCNSAYPHQSTKLMEELEKSKCSKEVSKKDCKDEKKQVLKKMLNDHHRKYYIPAKWREDRANNFITSALPLERLFVIRSNLKQFLKKWGNKGEETQTELSKLQSPKQFKKFKYFEGVEWASGVTTMAGSVLTLADFSTTGGIITLVAPAIGAGASHWKEKLYEAKQSKWEEFKTDANDFLDNYNELLGILKPIEVNKWGGQVNEALKDLKG